MKSINWSNNCLQKIIMFREKTHEQIENVTINDLFVEKSVKFNVILRNFDVFNIVLWKYEIYTHTHIIYIHTHTLSFFSNIIYSIGGL